MPPAEGVARANSALRDLRRADQSREGASPSWHIRYDTRYHQVEEGIEELNDLLLRKLMGESAETA